MTIQELGQTLLEILTVVWKGLGEIFRCVGDIIINNSASPEIAIPTSSLKLFSNVTLNRIVFFLIIAYILFINIYTFLKFADDKEKAKRKQRRISEKHLLMLCFIGGATGGVIGMNTVRHKTKKKYFVIFGITMMIIQIILFCSVLGYMAFWAFF